MGFLAFPTLTAQFFPGVERDQFHIQLDLAEGSARLAEKYGAPELSMSVKKLEMPAYDPRGMKGMGLGYATSNRGACHLRGYSPASELGVIGFESTDADEVRAWQLGKGETALGAAATIHSDLARGFIRAEVIAYDDLGAEALRRLEVEDFPAIVVNDIYGGDAYEDGLRQYNRE